MTDCDCATSWQPEPARVGEYARIRRILNRGHPVFIGPDQVNRAIRLGGCWCAVIDGEDVAVGIVNPRRSVLLALNVHPSHRGHGLGGRLLTYLAPNWVRATEERVSWFEARGFQPVGAPKQGRSLRTQIMVRSDLIGLAGRLDARFDALKRDAMQGRDTGVEAGERDA